MPLLTGSVGSIQTGLELLIGVRRSLGYISQTIQAAGAAAEAYNEGLRVPVAVLGEADEIFAGRKPSLTVVDGRSLLVLNLTAADGREATHWGLTFLELADQGLVFQDVAADGAGGIRAGLREAQLNLLLRPDLFHLLREAKRLQNRLEKGAYKAIRTADQAQQAEQETRQSTRRKGRPLKVELSVEEATQKEQQALATHDNFAWLMSDIRQVLEPITTDHRIQSAHQAQQTIQAALQLLESLPGEKLAAFTRQLGNHLDVLLARLVWLHQTLAPWPKYMPPTLKAWMIATWSDSLHRLEDIPPVWRGTATAIWDALSLFHPTSSLAESRHSWLRPYLSIHRGMPDWLLPILQLFCNHHLFSRGMRAGQSPLQLAGIDNPPTLASIIDNLFANPATA